MSFAGSLYRLGRASARRRRLVVAIWVLVALGLAIGLSAAGPVFVDDFRMPGTESQRALDLLRERFPAAAGTSATLVFQPAAGSVGDPDNTQAISSALAAVRELPHVVSVGDPAAADGAGGVSGDGAVAFAQVRYDTDEAELGKGAVDALDEAVEDTRARGVQVELNGPLVEGTDHPEPGASEGVGILAAVLVLLLAFGSVVAMGLPIATALLGLLVGISLVMVLSLLLEVPTVAPTIAMMIGLGVGIDYALFIVSRYRENLRGGADVEDAIGRAIATSGSAVVFAGGTVIVAMLSLWISGIRLVGLLGSAAAITVAVAVIAALTLLPALLGFAGRTVDRLRVPSLGRDRGDGSGFWVRWSRAIARRPWTSLAASVLVLGVLTVPLFSMRLGQVDGGVAPEASTERRAYDLLAEGFGPGFNGPLLISVELPEDAGSEVLDGLSAAVVADPGVIAVMPPMTSADGRTAVVTAIPTSAPRDPATSDLVHRLRERTVPEALDGSGAQAFLGGVTASYIDLTDRVSERLPWFIGTVVLLSFLLLVVVFRSILVPLKAAIVNVLSIGAAYGVVVAIFQWGWGKDLVGLEQTVPIVSFVPMIMFAILFGLSMDYEVFLLSRVREEHLLGRDDVESVVSGLSATARVITSAALIMVAVFLAFVLNEDPAVKMAGVGLATAVAVDATIVRLALVPATMVLLGRANWWLPRWLDRLLPRIDVEGQAGLPETEPRGADTRPLAGERRVFDAVPATEGKGGAR